MQTIFAAELVLKLIEKGLIWHPDAYMRNPWDLLDGFIVVTSIIALGLSSANLSIIKMLRLVRALRPLRMIQRWSGLRLVVETLLQAAPAVHCVVLFGVFQFCIFAILCVQLFAGKLSVCSQVRVLLCAVGRDDCCTYLRDAYKILTLQHKDGIGVLLIAAQCLYV